MNLTLFVSRRYARIFGASLGMLLIAACGSRPPAPVVDRSITSPRAAEGARTPSTPAPRPPAARPAPPVATPAPVAVARPFAARPAPGPASTSAGTGSAASEAPLIQVETIRSDAAPPRTMPTRPATASATSPKPAVAETPQPAAGQAPPAAPAPSGASQRDGMPAQAAVQPAARAAQPPAQATQPPAGASGGRFVWPVPGPVLEGFSDAQNPALYLDGRPGDPVVAAADGRVIFSGQGPKGYGNLIIVRHDDQFLSVYGHNRALLAKDGDQVKQGQTIAELGSSDSDRPRLRFEIRRDGRPVDPVKLLPPR